MLVAVSVTASESRSQAPAFNVNNLTPVTVSLESLNEQSSPMLADTARFMAPWRNTSSVAVSPTTLNAYGLPTSAGGTSQIALYNGNTWNPVAKGRYVVKWTGTGDVRLQSKTGTNATLLAGSTPAGVHNGGTRIYDYQHGSMRISVSGLTATGLTSLQVWMPHPKDPTRYSLEPSERSAYNAANSITEHPQAFHFHPTLIEILKERPWGAIRPMGFLETNDNPCRFWDERRLPNASPQTGATVARSAFTGELYAPGSEFYSDPGAAWEFVIALCNVTNRDLWVTVPHLSVLSRGSGQDYSSKLAQLIAYGSNASGTIYSPSHTGTKVHPGLNSNLKVWVEYSNEVWNSRFKQNSFVNTSDSVRSIPQTMALYSKYTWEAFEAIPALGAARVVRLLGCQQRNASNLTSSLNELYNAQGSFAEAVVTASYFGNSIELYIRDAILQGERPANANEPIDPDRPNGPRHPQYVYTEEAHARLTNEAYYNKTFDEWMRRVLKGDSNAGNAYDSTGFMGGIDPAVYTAAAARGLRVVATEGGASIYTSSYDNNSPDDDLLTDFVKGLPTRPRMGDLQRVHLELGRLRGLRAYNIFELTGTATSFGQWAVLALNGRHNEPTDPFGTKYRAIKSFFDEFDDIRHVDLRIGSGPEFTTPAVLADWRISDGTQSRVIQTTGATSLTVVGKYLVPGLSIATGPTTATITGTPSRFGANYVLLRALDADGDPTWQICRFNVKDYVISIYFNNLPTHSTPVYEIDTGRHVLSIDDGSSALQVVAMTPGSQSTHALRITGAKAMRIDYDVSNDDPLNQRSFNFDSVRLARPSTGTGSIIGAQIEAVDERGVITAVTYIPLSGSANVFSSHTLPEEFDNVFTIRLTFYSARTPVAGSNPVRYTITPAGGGLLDDIRLNN
jgi:hypothetical protein